MSDDSTRSGISHFFLNALRIVVALMFMQHGAQKMFGMFGAEAVTDTFSLRWWAGVLELYGGGLVLLGLWTRPVAFLLAGQMAYAYFFVHVPRSAVPITNGGELAVLYCWAFLFFAAVGGGAFSLDGFIAARRRSKVDG